MAFIPYLAFGPTALLGWIGLLHGPDHHSTPRENWADKTIDLLIPAFNEEDHPFCLSAIERQTLKPRCIFYMTMVVMTKRSNMQRLMQSWLS